MEPFSAAGPAGARKGGTSLATVLREFVGQ